MQPFTVEQARAARAFLGWSQHELGDAAGLSFETIRDFENSRNLATAKTLAAMRNAFQKSGVEFHRRGERVGVTIVVWSQPW
jgi:transcriptional regulator with XRE-family HTH domain